MRELVRIVKYVIQMVYTDGIKATILSIQMV